MKKNRLYIAGFLLAAVNLFSGCSEDDPSYAFCLREILSNLVDNAVKYSNEEVLIVLSGTKTEDGTIVRVHDNGIGIPLSEQHKIFNKFERIASGSRKTGASGFGLGLNYVLQEIGRASCRERV